MLTNAGVTATLRREKGHDIAAACGQLRLKQDALVCFRASDPMYELFRDVEEAPRSTLEIAARCDVKLDLGKFLLLSQEYVPAAAACDRRQPSLWCADPEPIFPDVPPNRFRSESCAANTAYSASLLFTIDSKISTRKRDIPVT